MNDYSHNTITASGTIEDIKAYMAHVTAEVEGNVSINDWVNENKKCFNFSTIVPVPKEIFDLIDDYDSPNYCSWDYEDWANENYYCNGNFNGNEGSDSKYKNHGNGLVSYTWSHGYCNDGFIGGEFVGKLSKMFPTLIFNLRVHYERNIKELMLNITIHNGKIIEVKKDKSHWWMGDDYEPYKVNSYV